MALILSFANGVGVDRVLRSGSMFQIVHFLSLSGECIELQLLPQSR